MEAPVWVLDNKEGYIRRSVPLAQLAEDEKKGQNFNFQSESAGGEAVVTLDSVPTQVWRSNPAELDGTPDLTRLHFLSTPSIAHNLSTRYAKDQIYTSASAPLLVSINPFHPLSIYTPEEMKKYSAAADLGELEPHVYGIAEHAFRAMKREHGAVSIVTSGRSGSGKTENVKSILRYLSPKGAIAEKVVQALAVFHALGNASTSDNLNSSRFITLISLNFAGDGLVGGSVTPALLQTARLCGPVNGERNFHLLHALADNVKLRTESKINLLLGDQKGSDFQYLRGTPDKGANAETVANDFLALTALGVSQADRDSFLSSVAAVLHLGNVMPFHKQGYKPGPSIIAAATLLGLPLEDLVENLSTKKTVSKGQSIPSERTAVQFTVNRDLIAKCVYSAVFYTLVSRLNTLLGEEKKGEGTIHIFDSIGFTSKAGHQYEQLCINYTAEKINQFFINRLLSSEQAEYEKERLNWRTLMAQDRSGCLQLMESTGEQKDAKAKESIPSGIFSLCVEGRKTQIAPKKLLEGFLKDHRFNRFLFSPAPYKGGARKSMTADEMRKQEALSVSFGIRHFAGEVIYNASDFIRRDQDDTPDEQLAALFAKSSNPILKAYLGKYEDQSKTGLGINYVKHLRVVMSKLTASTSFFIPCFLPNPDQKSKDFNFGFVLSQIQSEGLVETSQILKKGFPLRFSFTSLMENFKKFLTDCGAKEPDPTHQFYDGKVQIKKAEGKGPRYLNIRDFCEAVFFALGAKRTDVQTGVTKLFVRQSAGSHASRALSMDANALTAQEATSIRKWLVKKKMHKARSSARFLGYLVNLAKKRHSVLVIQAVIGAVNGWNDREGKSHGRKDAAVKVTKFIRWAARERLILGWRAAVSKLLTQIRADKEEEKARSERQHQRWKVPPHVLADLAVWMSGVINRPIVASLMPGLRDGEAICDLITGINPAYKVEGIKRGKKQAFFWRENLMKATKFMELTMSCPAWNLFTPDDLLSDVVPNYKKIVYCLQWLARYAYLQYEIPLPTYIKMKMEAGEDVGDSSGGDAAAAAEEKLWEETPEQRAMRERLEREQREAFEREREKALRREQYEKQKKTKGEDIQKALAILKAGMEFEKLSMHGKRVKHRIFLNESDQLVYTKSEDKEVQPRALDLKEGFALSAGKQTPLLQKKGKKLDDENCFAIIGKREGGLARCLEFYGEELEKKKEYYWALETALTWHYNNALRQEEIDRILASEKDALREIEDIRKARLEKERLEREAAERLAALLKRLQENWKHHLGVLLKGSNFKQYKGQRVFTRWTAGVAPKKLEAIEDFDAVLEAMDDFRLIFTSIEDKSSVSAVVTFPHLEQATAGKADDGKCFPAELAEDEKVIQDSKCLVIAAKNRMIGLESEDEKIRDDWVAAINWATEMVRYAEQKKALAAQEGQASLDPLLIKGAWFTKHGLQGVTRRYIRCTPSHIYWLKDQDSELSECVDPISWADVQDVRQGKQTLMFSRARAADVADSLCLSIVYRADKRTLDLVADSNEQAFEWYEAMSGYFMELKEQRDRDAAVQTAEKEKQIEEAKRLLEQQREQYEREKLAISADLEGVQRTLKERRKSLDASAAQLEAEMSKVHQEKDRLVATVEELTKRVQKLKEDLDDSLQQKASFLEELQALQEENHVASAVRREIVAEKQAAKLYEQQIAELSVILSTALNPKWAELDAGVSRDLQSFLAALARA